MPTNYIDRTPKISTYKIREGVDSSTGKKIYQPYYFWTTAAAVAEVNVAAGVEGRFFTHISSTTAQEGEFVVLKAATIGSTTYLRPEASGITVLPVSKGGTGLTHIGAGEMLIGDVEGDEYTTVTLSNTVAAGNNNPVTSGAVFTALSEIKQNILVVWSESDYEDTEIPTPQMLAKIPNVVTVKFSSGTQTAQGSLSPSASVKNNIYFIYDKNGNQDKFDEYVATPEYDGSSTYVWEKIGDTGINLNGYIYKDTTSGSYQANKILISSDTDGKVTATVSKVDDNAAIYTGSTLTIPSSRAVKEYVEDFTSDRVSTDEWEDPWVADKILTTVASPAEAVHKIKTSSYSINGSTWGSSATTSIPTTALVSSRATKVYASIDEPANAVEGDIWIEIENTGS